MGNGYNTKGRGYPDVALIGHLYPIVNSGEVQYKDGTSASTPVMAGILSLVNAERLKLKKSSGKYKYKSEESVHRVYGKHCSWHFYSTSLFQTYFIVFATVSCI